MSISEQVKHLLEIADRTQNEAFFCEWYNDYVKDLRQAAHTIEALSAKLQVVNMENGGGWISCEDRLPRIGQIVIVCQSFRGIHGNPGTSTSIGQYLGSDDDNVPNWRFISYRANIHERLVSAYMVDNWQIIGNNEYVIAWQPLPEPYHPQP